MNTLTLYVSQSKLSPDHIKIPTKFGPIYIRVKTSKVGAWTALERAKPKKGETLLNSVEMDEIAGKR